MNRRILVVDDDRQMVQTLCDVLRLHDWSADGAYSSEAAIEAVRRTSYGAVVMDVRMPGVDGLAALKVIRADRPHLPVMLMTAYPTRDLVLDAEREGALRVILKPVEPSLLLRRLERLLRGARSVLIVDDDLAFLRTLADALRVRGFLVAEARSLDAALGRLKAERPAAVVLHLRLDNLSPEESILAIRGASPAVTLISYSGHPPTLHASETAVPRDWVSAWLEKPFAVERLTALLDELVAN